MPMPDGDWVRLTHVELGEHLGKMLTYEREHIDAQVRYVEKLVEHERELRLGEAEARSRALANQADEYSRRLAELNNEAKRIKEIEASTVPREMYDNDKDAREKWEREVNARVAAVGSEMMTKDAFATYLKGRGDWEAGISKQLDRYGGALALMAVMLTLLSIFLKFVYPW